MSISQAMQTAVAGLGANAKAINRVSENIANASTVGFKRSFEHFIAMRPGEGSGISVTTETGTTNGTSTSITSTDSALDLAISGSGFFVVSKVANPTQESDFLLTRAGSFTADQQGNLVNSAGYFLAGYQADMNGVIGAVDATSLTSLSTVNVKGLDIVASPSTAASVSGNLPAGDTGTGVTNAPLISTMKYANALGQEESLQFSWQSSGATEDLWTLTISDAAGTTYGSVDIAFNDSGATPGAPASYAATAATGLTAPSAFSMDETTGLITLTINNGAVPQVIEIGLGEPGTYQGMTQFGGDYTTASFDVNGKTASPMASAEFDDKGRLYAVYQDGTRQVIYEVPLAMVGNPEGLVTVDGTAWRISGASGSVTLQGAGTGGAGSIVSYGLEDSNVDVADEMTDLIRIQRAYTSNTKVVSTADEMLQDAVNLKR